MHSQTLSANKMTVKSDTNAHLLLSSTPILWNKVSTYLQSSHSWKQRCPPLNTTWTYSTPPRCCVSIHSTLTRACSFYCRGFVSPVCLCLLLSPPVRWWSLSGHPRPPLTKLWSDQLPSNPMTAALKGLQYLLETQNVVGIQSSVEFVMASPSDKYRGACLSSHDEGGLSHVHY